MFCSKCGKEVASEERFCLRCGSHEKQQTPIKYGNDKTQRPILIDLNEWYYLSGGKPNVMRGPFSESAIRKMVNDGFLNDKTLVRSGRDGCWRPTGDVPEFKNLFKAFNTFKLITLRQLVNYFLIGLFVWLCFYGVKEIINKKQTIDITNKNERTFPSPSREVQTKNTNTSSPPLQWGLTKDGVIAQTNKARRENGDLPLLVENQMLNIIAEKRLKDMFENQYFSHYPPSGETYSELAVRFGYEYNRLAENIASGTYRNDEKIIAGWMQSPGHRANILSPYVSEIGVAVGKGSFKGHETWIGVQIFGHPPDHH